MSRCFTMPGTACSERFELSSAGRANPTREADVDFQMVDLNLVLRQMQSSGTKLNLVILDACRNNPSAHGVCDLPMGSPKCGRRKGR
jgi:hypothetical protein